MKTVELPGCSFTSGIDTIYESDPDDENLSHFENSGLRERRRKLHTEAEQRRRNAIKKGFDRLVELLNPVKHKPSSAVRMNKSIILQKSISKVQKLMKLRDQKIEEFERLDKTFQALHVFYSNYEQIAQDESVVANTESIPEEIKLRVFQMFADHLFSSFEPSITIAPHVAVSRSMIQWVEANGKPERLSPLMDSLLASIFNTSLPSRSQEIDCASDTSNLQNTLDVNQQMPHAATLLGPEWLDEQRADDNVRTMGLDDRLSSRAVDSEVITDHRSIHRPCSMTFVAPNQCVGDIQPSFSDSNSSSSMGTRLSSSDLLNHVQFQTDFSSSSTQLATDPATTPVTPHSALHCILSRPSGNGAQHSANELQFHSNKLGACDSTFLYQNCTASSNDNHVSHGFHTDQPPAKACVQAAQSAVGSTHNELCRAFNHPYPLPYL